MLWKFANHHILETLTSTEKIFGPSFSIYKKRFSATIIFGKYCDHWPAQLKQGAHVKIKNIAKIAKRGMLIFQNLNFYGS